MPNFVRDVEEIRQRAARKIEEGPITEGYRGDVNKTLDILNEALATEIVCVLRYMHHYFMSTGVHGSSVADEFKEHADAERQHADAIAERIQQLGGKPDYNPRSLLERSVTQYVEGETLADMIREDLIAERIVIEVYQDMVRHFGNNDPTTRHMIEEILADEEEHASDLSDLLYIVEPSTGKTQGEDPGADPLKIAEMEQRERTRPNGGQREQQSAATNVAVPKGPRTATSLESSQQNRGAMSVENRGEKEASSNRKNSSSGDANTRLMPKGRTGRGETPEVDRDRTRPAPDEPGTVIGELRRMDRDRGVPERAGRGQRNRNQTPPSDDEGGELHDGQQGGQTRAVRVTRPNRKKRIA